MRKKVLVLGGNFGGLTTALSLKHEPDSSVDVTVVSAADHFLFNPSLIWVPFGKRRPEDITFPLAPTFAEHGIEFVHATATHIDPALHEVETTAGARTYDYLVIATGYRNAMDAVPGLDPANRAYTITTLDDAVRAGDGWQRFLDDPGPVVVASAPGAACFGAGYEFLFNAAYEIKCAGVEGLPLTYVTPEPFLGHFGIGGLPGGEKLLGTFLEKQGIRAITNVAINEITPGRMRLCSGETIPFAYAMVIPPFLGQEVVRNTPNLTNESGFVPVHDTYESKAYPDIYAVGVATAVVAPWTTAVPVGVPKTGFPTEAQAHVAAKNIAARIRGEEQTKHKEFADIPAVCVLDAGNNGVLILADKMLPPRKRGVLVPGPQAHGAKLLFEKYFLWKSRNGYVRLP